MIYLCGHSQWISSVRNIRGSLFPTLAGLVLLAVVGCGSAATETPQPASTPEKAGRAGVLEA